MSIKETALPKVQTKLFINGKWTDGDNKETKDIVNPANGEVIAKIAQAGPNETKKAIKAAKEAFPDWAKMELADRVKLLHKIADLMEEKADTLAKIMTLEQGKPLKESKGEVLTGAENFRFAAEEARRLYGNYPSAKQSRVYRQKTTNWCSCGHYSVEFPRWYGDTKTCSSACNRKYNRIKTFRRYAAFGPSYL